MSRQIDLILNMVLKSVRAGAKAGLIKESGICSAVMNRVGLVLKARNAGKHACAFRLEELICSWPETADQKSSRWAVCSADQHKAEAKAGTQWQNPRRLALLDWMIKETSKCHVAK